MTAARPLTALAVNCTLTRGPGESSTQLMTDLVLDALGKHGVTTDSIRLVDLDAHPDDTPPAVASTIASMTANAAQPASLLRDTPYPPS